MAALRFLVTVAAVVSVAGALEVTIKQGKLKSGEDVE